MTTKKATKTLQLKITLVGAKPPIWRRVLVPADMTLDQLHLVIQKTMGWMNYHLHLFNADGRLYGIPDDDFMGDMGMQDEAKVKLNGVLRAEKDNMIYEYDFGDSWEHKVVLEKILDPDPTQTLPLCIKGKRACPPEDCGGVWGYAGLLATLADPNHAEHEDMLEWLGGPFDAEAFNVGAANFALLKMQTDH